jgi:acetyl esterase/lipase
MLRLFLLLVFAFTAHAGSFTSENDVEYGKVNGKPLLLDVMRPVSRVVKPRPAIVFVHGGGWIIGDKRGMRAMAETAAREGFVCFNINYRLAFGAENNWPAALDDSQRAVRWVRANAARYGVDPERMGAVGGSAGGHLVTFLGTTDTLDNSDPALARYSSRTQCVVNLFGPTDLTDDLSQKVEAGLASNDMVRQFLGGTPQQKPDAARAASPLWRVDAKSAPFLIFHGRLDTLVPPDHSERLYAALQKAGVESKLVMFENEGHGWKKKETQDRFAAETLAFLKKHLRP